MVTLRELIMEEMRERKETWEDVVACTLPAKTLDVEFDNGYGGTEGKPFTLWTTNRVYFPIHCDGSAWIQSMPRNPCDETTKIDV